MDNNLVRCEIYNRESSYTAVYVEKSIAYIKRFKIGGAIMNRDYFNVCTRASDKSKLILLADGILNLYTSNTLQPVKNQRIHQQRFNPSETAEKSAKARGNRLSSKGIKYIDIAPGRWWDKADDGEIEP